MEVVKKKKKKESKKKKSKEGMGQKLGHVGLVKKKVFIFFIFCFFFFLGWREIGKFQWSGLSSLVLQCPPLVLGGGTEN